MDIAKAVEDGWRLFAKDVAAFIIGALIAGVLSVVTIGILAPALIGGLFRMALNRVRQGRPAEIGDVFSALDRFWTLLGAAILLVVLIGIGLVFFIVPGLLLAGIWFYVFPLILDKRMGVFEAMTESRRLVGQRGGLALHVVMVLLFSIGSSVVSSITGGLGTLLTLPLTITITVVMYFIARGEEQLLPAAVGGPRHYVQQPPQPPVQPIGVWPQQPTPQPPPDWRQPAAPAPPQWATPQAPPPEAPAQGANAREQPASEGETTGGGDETQAEKLGSDEQGPQAPTA